MRGAWLRLGVVCAVGAIAACGGSKKEAASPSDGPAYADETPRWEGAARPEERAPSGASSGGRAPVEQRQRRSDEYDKEGTEVALKRAARQVKDNCGAAKDENGKAIGPWGKATIQVILGSNGHSKGTVVPGPFQGQPTGNCVERAFAKLTYPPWGGDDLELDWEVELVEPPQNAK